MASSSDLVRNVNSDLRVIGEALARISRSLHEHTRQLEIAVEGRYTNELDNPRVALLNDSLNVSRATDLELEKLNQSLKRVVQKLQTPIQLNENSPSTATFEWEREALTTSTLRLKQERNELGILYEIAGTLNSTLQFDEVLRLVMDRVIDFVNAERGFLMLINPDTQQPEFRIARNKEARTISESEFSTAQISRSTVMRVINTRRPVLTDNTQTDASLQGMESIMTYGILSIMCAPLIVRNTCIGAVYVDSRINENLFAPRHLDMMLAFCNQAAIAIDNARLFAQVREDKLYMENILRAITNGVIITDTSGTITIFSHAAGEILRLNPQSVIGKNYQEVFDTLPFVSLIELLQKAISSADHSTDIHYSVDIPGRGLVTLRMHISSLHDSQGTRIGTVLVIDDSSEFEQNPGKSSSPEHKETLSSNGNTASNEIMETPVYSSSNFRIRILEEPLTTQNFTTIISALTELHAKCWLIQHGRFADLIDYTQTRNVRFAEEAHLVIDKLTHNSPADIKFSVNADASPQSLVEALTIAIDGVAQAPMRRKAAELENHAKELEIKLKEQEAQSVFEDKKQSREIEAQRANLEREKSLLEIERQQLELQKVRLELAYEQINLATETSGKMIEILYPEADETTKVMLIQSLLPQLLQLEHGKGLILALPISTTNRSDL